MACAWVLFPRSPLAVVGAGTALIHGEEPLYLTSARGQRAIQAGDSQTWAAGSSATPGERLRCPEGKHPAQSISI